jgi:hypothetical protein
VSPPDERADVAYDDYDGISMLCDQEALIQRYRDHDLRGCDDPHLQSVTRHPIETLLDLTNRHELVAWGTHQPNECRMVLASTPFSDDERARHGVRSTLEVGRLTVRGTLCITAWHAFTYGCDYLHGRLESPSIPWPAGTYTVTVHRPFAADEQASDAVTVFLVALIPIAHDTPHEPLVAVPGADGWFA